MQTDPESGWSLVTINIPSNRIDKIVENPDALKIAYDLGILELLGLGIALLGVALVIIGFAAFYSIRNAAKRTARDVSQDLVPGALEDYMKKDGFAALNASLRDPEVIAAIQAAIARLGLADVEEADDVENYAS